MGTARLAARVGKWAAIAGAAILALALIALALIYILSERAIALDLEVSGTAVPIPVSAADLEEGERLAHITGCSGCHGPDLGGRVFFDGGVLMARLAAPDLTRLFRDASTEDLELAVRKGIGIDGRTLMGMPSGMYRNLTDEHLGQIVAWIRSMPIVERELPNSFLGPMARVALIMGELESDAKVVSRLGPGMGMIEPELDLDNPETLGAYMAQIACTECHGHDLSGNSRMPHLGIARAYSPEQFQQLMRTGEAIGGRELELMSAVSVSRFSHFTDEEIRALYDHLAAL